MDHQLSQHDIFISQDGQLQLTVAVDTETVWLTQAEICVLFDRERSVITKHINNIFKEGELERDSVCAIFARTADDGKTHTLTKQNVAFSISYRVQP
ncbi:hypothetical protein [Shewanella baltica]|uniref:hypothetical protein n=1 Tax=Shewanella baltica TaxID=62322 RepID=UPI003D79BF76